MIPGMSRLASLVEIRKSRSLAELSVIVVTGRSCGPGIKEALARGASDYITKPVDFDLALASLLALLRIGDFRTARCSL